MIVLNFIIGIVALIIAVLLFMLLVLTYDRVIPILEQMNRTINNVADMAYTMRGTTEFVGEKVVSPFIQVSGYAAGAARILREIVDLWPGSKHTGNGQGSPIVEEQLGPQQDL